MGYLGFARSINDHSILIFSEFFSPCQSWQRAVNRFQNVNDTHYWIYFVAKKSLTIWILLGLVAGAEFGFSFPQTAGSLQFLSEIFLRMIKTIIAPLLFATLVNGIAGHTDLKQVGRMGWKSLLYFETASTLALVIGLIAINISKAGVGINLSAITGNVPAVTTKMQTTQEFILHIFPENIAKAISEGNILQIVIFSIILGSPSPC